MTPVRCPTGDSLNRTARPEAGLHIRRVSLGALRRFRKDEANAGPSGTAVENADFALTLPARQLSCRDANFRIREERRLGLDVVEQQLNGFRGRFEG